MKLYLNILNNQAFGHRLKIACDRKAVKSVVRQHPFPAVQGQVCREKQDYQSFPAAVLPSSHPTARLNRSSSGGVSQVYDVKVLFLKAESYRSSIFNPGRFTRAVSSLTRFNGCLGTTEGVTSHSMRGGMSDFATRDHVMLETPCISAAQPGQPRQKPT